MAAPDAPSAKAALVVGAADPVGRECAVALARAGADVAVAPLAPEPREIVQIHSVANEIWSLGRRNLAIEAGTGAASAISAAVARARAEFGRLDIVVIASDDPSLAAAASGAGAPTVIALDPEDPRPPSEIAAEAAASATAA